MISAANFFWTNGKGFQFTGGDEPVSSSVVFYFFDKRLSRANDPYEIMRRRFPTSLLCGCSSSGPILDDDIYPDAITGMALSFDKTIVRGAQVSCLHQEDSFEAGKAIVEKLIDKDLRHIFAITDGMTVHGTQFINGANSALPNGVRITGGMASDGFEFKRTTAGINARPEQGQVCAIGFYGRDLEVGSGAEGGWDKFGLERVVTKSQGNILFELDGQPALDLYKEYLGPDADKLPGSGLLFPLAIRNGKDSESIVRTIDLVDENTKALRFTGDIPQGWLAQFMKGNFAHLVEGAGTAARKARAMIHGQNGVALVVSCLGRQLLLGHHTGDELHAIKSALGENIPAVGFYSNGEYSDQKENGFCVMHNQTMTLTVFHEK